jgi:predicted patatin/cPLA2 family phospholipase
LQINNQEYYDGSLFYPSTFQCAKELGCTHVLVLNTNPQDYEEKPWGTIVEHMLKRLDETYAHVGTHYIEALREYCLLANELPWGETAVNDMRMYRLAVQTSTGLKRLTTDHAKLLYALRAGYQSVMDCSIRTQIPAFYPQGCNRNIDIEFGS